jgi:hypothetical protein
MFGYLPTLPPLCATTRAASTLRRSLPNPATAVVDDPPRPPDRGGQVCPAPPAPSRHPAHPKRLPPRPRLPLPLPAIPRWQRAVPRLVAGVARRVADEKV